MVPRPDHRLHQVARLHSVSSTTVSARQGTVKSVGSRRSSALPPVCCGPSVGQASNLAIHQPGFRAQQVSRDQRSSAPPLVPTLAGHVTRPSCVPSPEEYIEDDEYTEEIEEHMLRMEQKTRPMIHLMDSQPEVDTWFIRPYLIDFMLEMHITFNLRPETLYVGVGLLDQYLSMRVVLKKHVQLAGAAALWIAAKYEDSKENVPSAADLSALCWNLLDEAAFHQMESHILVTLGFSVGRPSHETWLKLFLNQSHSLEESTRSGTIDVARMILEMSLYHRELVALPPSSVTNGVLWLVQMLLNMPAPLSFEMSQAYQLLDLAARETVHVLHYALGHDDVSPIVSSRHAESHKTVRTIFRMMYQRQCSTMVARTPNLHAQSSAMMATPPARARATVSESSMSPTPGLWLTPQMEESPSTTSTEDNNGPQTPSVDSPLPGRSSHGGALHSHNSSADVSPFMYLNHRARSTLRSLVHTANPQSVVEPPKKQPDHP